MAQNVNPEIGSDETSTSGKMREETAALSKDSHSVSRRLQQELMTLMMSGDKGISAFPEGENLFRWIGTIHGPAGTACGTGYNFYNQGLQVFLTRNGVTFSKHPVYLNKAHLTPTLPYSHYIPQTNVVYEGLTYKLMMEFPSSYPYKPPNVIFTAPMCFHPNVDQSGNICLDILKDKWSALYDVRTILLSIQSLLAEPNNDSPLNTAAAEMWANQTAYRKHLLEKYKECTDDK